MAKNIGKIFEEEIKNSVSKEHWYYRFKDGTATYNKDIENKKVRFQAKNICDCQVMANDKLFLLELKNTKGYSLPLSNIKSNQVDGLSGIDHKNIESYFIICFREKEKCYAVQAIKIKRFIESEERKSIPMDWFIENGIDVPMIKKKVRYKYDLDILFNWRGDKHVIA